jgi:hypothetical protein
VRYVALLVALIIMAIVALVVFKAVTDSTENTLSLVAATTTVASGGAAIGPGPGGQPIPLGTQPDAVQPAGGAGIAAAKRVACQADKTSMQQAIDAYTGLEGDKPADEQALIAKGYLKQLSAYWDVKDGVLVPQDPACAA